MKRLLATATLIAFFISIIPNSYAAVTAGTKCTKVNTKQTYKNRIYTCIKLGNKLYWGNGIKVPKSNSSTKSNAIPVVPDKPYVSPSPSSKLPTTLMAVLRFSGTQHPTTSWGTGLSKLYCEIPADAIVQEMFPNYSAGSVNWSQTNMKIFDGSNKLLGIANSYPVYKIFNDGSCSVTFTMDGLLLTQGPLIFQTGSSPRWTVAYSGWVGGQVLLNGDNTVIRYG